MDEVDRRQINIFHNKNINSRFIIDSQTRLDLNIDDFYTRYNNTLTSYGDQILYHNLNSQPEKLEQTDQIIKSIKNLKENRSSLNLIDSYFKKIGKQKRGNIFNDIWDGLKYRPGFLRVVPLWVIFTPLLIYLLFSISSIAGLILLTIYPIVNLSLFYITNNKINYSAGSMNYLIKTLSILKKMRRDRELNSLLDRFDYNLSLNRICKYDLFLKDGFGTPNPFVDLAGTLIDYIRIFLCAEIFAYYRITKYIDRYRDDIRNILEFTGNLDTLSNTIKIMDVNTTSTPQFLDDGNIGFKKLIHPLVENCTPYNHNIDNSMIITGMNMAGKSTFLKSIALNQILASSLGFTFSEQFTTSQLYVVCSMKIDDDLESKKSRYYKEAERLLYIQNLLKERKVLSMIDEILTGTNTEDRIFASIGLLKNFYSYPNSLILAATHDRKISEDLSELYDNYYFDGILNGKKIDYDYTPKKGVVTRRNALLLLQKMGINI